MRITFGFFSAKADNAKNKAKTTNPRVRGIMPCPYVPTLANGKTFRSWQSEFSKEIGGAEQIRTADLVIANDALFQLSYGPEN